VSNVDTVVVPIGGGGLIAGIALAVKKLSKGRVKVVMKYSRHLKI
jgi:threonine dehydratase